MRYICRLTKYEEIRKLIIEMPKLRSFPVVDDPSNKQNNDFNKISYLFILSLIDAVGINFT